MLKLVHILTDTNIGGAGILLLNQLKTIDRGVFEVSVVLPRGAELATEVRNVGVKVIEVDGIADRSFSVRGIIHTSHIIIQIDVRGRPPIQGGPASLRKLIGKKNYGRQLRKGSRCRHCKPPVLQEHCRSSFCQK